MSPGAALVCVTGQRNCERLIRRGAQVAQEHGLSLLALCVVGSGRNDLADPQVADALDYLYRAGAENGAEMTVLCSPNAVETIVGFARQHGARHIILGEGRPTVHGESFAARLAAALPEAVFHLTP